MTACSRLYYMIFLHLWQPVTVASDTPPVSPEVDPKESPLTYHVTDCVVTYIRLIIHS